MRLDENEAKQIADQVKKEGATYVEKYIAPFKEHLTLILRTHLVMEKLIDEILTAALMKSEEILKMSFYHKVRVIEALGINQNKIIPKLTTFNTLRNKYAHDLDYGVAQKDIEIFFENASLKKSGNITDQLTQVSAWIIYFLMGVRTFYAVLPFYISCHDNKDRLKRDKGFSIELIDDVYKSMNLDTYLNSIRLE